MHPAQRSTLLLALLALGCGDQTKAESTSAAAPITSERPASAVSASASPTTPEQLDRSTIKTKPASKPLFPVAYLKEEAGFMPGGQASSDFVIHPFRDRMVVTKAGHVYELEDGDLKLKPKAVTTEKVEKNTPLLGAYEIRRLEGYWPEDLWAEAHFSSFFGARQSSSRDVAYVRHGGQWSVEKTLPYSVVHWTNGAFLGINGNELAVVHGSAKVELQPTKAEAKEGCSGALLRPFDVATLPSGEVYVLGQRCDTKKFALEYWPAGESKSRIEDLPELEAAGELMPYHHHIAVSSKNAVYVALSSSSAPYYLARFDGVITRRLETHDPGHIAAVWATPDGTFFGLNVGRYKGSNELHKLVSVTKDNRYQQFVPPKQVRLTALWATDENTAYASVGGEISGISVLLGTVDQKLLGTPPADLFKESPDSSSAASEVFPLLTESCSTPFLFLYDVSDRTPKKFDFPRTKKALKAFEKRTTETLLDFNHGGKRRLGITVPNADTGKLLLTHMKLEMPEDNPSLVCFAPPEGAYSIPL